MRYNNSKQTPMHGTQTAGLIPNWFCDALFSCQSETQLQTDAINRLQPQFLCKKTPLH